jgi:hypothetical protein
MSAIADGIDFLFKECVGGAKCGSNSQAGSKATLYACYLAAFTFMSVMFDFAIEPGYPDFSFVCFIGSTLQFLAFLSLCVLVKGNQSVAGISSQSLVMFAISLTCRTMSTSVYEGYLPADKTGDFMLQVVDVATLCLVVCVLYYVHKPYEHSYQREQDELSLKGILAACAVSAFFIHAELNQCDIFDRVWAFGLNVEVFQMLPQLYMLAKVGGGVPRQMVHYVVLTFLSALCRFAFWLWAIPGSEELSSTEGYSWNMELGGYYILIAYVIELIVHCDFMYYFVKALWKGSPVVLPQGDM